MMTTTTLTLTQTDINAATTPTLGCSSNNNNNSYIAGKQRIIIPRLDPQDLGTLLKISPIEINIYVYTCILSYLPNIYIWLFLFFSRIITLCSDFK